MQIQKADNYRDQIITLLSAEKLPINDLPEIFENFIVAIENDQLAGAAGLEFYDNYALLRSIVVSPTYRGKGIASNLLTEIESIATEKSIKNIYLLTETAPGYFTRKGYQTTTRADVPAAVQQSSEFSHVCPQSAIVMYKTLKPIS